jgi:putative ABC transport system permease protein
VQFDLIRSLADDLTYAVRRLAAAPAFTLTAVAILALGIGVNAAFFSVVNSVVLQGYAIPNIDTLVSITTVTNHGVDANRGITEARFRILEDRGARALTGSFMVRNLRAAATVGGSTQLVMAEAASGNYFRALGIRPAVGRLLGPLDDIPGVGGTAVISHRLWLRGYGGDPAVVGQTIRLSGIPLTVVGVTPTDFVGTTIPNLITTDVWLSLESAGHLAAASSGEVVGRAFARLAPGVTRDQADAEVRAVTRGVDPDRPDIFLAVIAAERALAPRQMVILQAAGSLALIVLAGLVLSIACANLGTLLLSRASNRATEVAVRMAIGAEPRRIFQMQFVETTILAVFGAGTALVVSGALMQLLGQVELPELQGVVVRLGARPDLRVFGYATLITIGTAVLIGLAPAARVANTQPLRVWSSAGGSGGVTPRISRRQARLIAFQIAVSSALVITTALLVRNITLKTEAMSISDSDHLILGHVDPRMQQVPDEEWPELARDLLLAAASIPGITAAGLSDVLPSAASITRVRRDDGPDTSSVLESRALTVSPHLFGAMRTPLLRGRTFSNDDSIGRPGVAVVSDSLAATLWPDEDPIGRQLSVTAWGTVEVVGVVASESPGRSPRERHVIYRPLSQAPAQPFVLMVRTAGDAPAMFESFKVAMSQRVPSVALFDLAAGSAALGPWLLGMKMMARLLAAVGLLGFLIAVVGLYGVMVYTVSQRSREFGICRALGASNWRLQAAVLKEASQMLLRGIAWGVLSVLLLARLTVGRFNGFVAFDLLTFVGVPMLLLAVGLGAAWLPARRASRVDAALCFRP